MLKYASDPVVETVLYITDLANDSDETLESACQLAERHGAHIELIHVIDVGQAFSRPDSHMEIQYRLETLGRRLRRLRDKVKSILLFGNPEDVISKRAIDIKAKLVAFGHDGSLSGERRQRLISVVSHRVACPVVTITTGLLRG